MAQPNAVAAVANIYRTPELWEKIVFTFLCLLLYRVGAHITVPGLVTSLVLIAITMISGVWFFNREEAASIDKL